VSVCSIIHLPHATAAGLPLSSLRSGDIDRLLSSSSVAPQRSAANAGSATLAGDVGS